jgi:hypothetical protein
MKSGPHFTALFVAATALAFASLILLFGLEASPPGAGLASGWVLLAVLLVLGLAVLAVSPTKAVREGRG